MLKIIVIFGVKMIKKFDDAADNIIPCALNYMNKLVCAPSGGYETFLPSSI